MDIDCGGWAGMKFTRVFIARNDEKMNNKKPSMQCSDSDSFIHVMMIDDENQIKSIMIERREN
jgi:hypothetical protein